MHLLAAVDAEGQAQRRPRQRGGRVERINYMTANADGLRCRERLAQGLPIGSRRVEGACKTVVGCCLKRGGARWLVPRVENSATRCGFRSGDPWERFWKSDAA